MIEHRTLSIASRAVADPANQLIVEPGGSALMDDLQLLEWQAQRVRKPRITVLSGSAGYDARTTTIDVTDYSEIKAFVRSLRSVVGSLVVFVAAAVLAITLSLMPASDGPGRVAGPLSGHSILHFPR
jgi:NAD(P)-dependent dehydrogenase (short-subunit alcohol dehydrogenase family)